MEILAANAVASRPRRAMHEGREFLVASATLIVPGVLNGSKGPGYYPPEEVDLNSSAWNHVPIVVYHPTDPVSGAHVSANSPGVLERQGIGELRQCKYDGKLRAETWFDVEKTRRVDPRILNSLRAGKQVELSTGLFTDSEPAPLGSHHNGRPYTWIARNHQPDHLAVLPDQVGACSIRDGCGILVNAKDSLGYGSEKRGEGMEHHFPLGGGFGRKGVSSRTKARRINKSVDDAINQVKEIEERDRQTVVEKRSAAKELARQNAPKTPEELVSRLEAAADSMGFSAKEKRDFVKRSMRANTDGWQAVNAITRDPNGQFSSDGDDTAEERDEPYDQMPRRVKEKPKKQKLVSPRAAVAYGSAEAGSRLEEQQRSIRNVDWGSLVTNAFCPGKGAEDNSCSSQEVGDLYEKAGHPDTTHEQVQSVVKRMAGMSKSALVETFNRMNKGDRFAESLHVGAEKMSRPKLLKMVSQRLTARHGSAVRVRGDKGHPLIGNWQPVSSCVGNCDNDGTPCAACSMKSLTAEDRRLGADAAQQKRAGSNPPNWAVDEEKWDRAKAAADKGEYEGDSYWAVVTHIYKNMGGGTKGKKVANVGWEPVTNAFCPGKGAEDNSCSSQEGGGANKVLLKAQLGSPPWSRMGESLKRVAAAQPKRRRSSRARRGLKITSKGQASRVGNELSGSGWQPIGNCGGEGGTMGPCPGDKSSGRSDEASKAFSPRGRSRKERAAAASKKAFRQGTASAHLEAAWQYSKAAEKAANDEDKRYHRAEMQRHRTEFRSKRASHGFEDLVAAQERSGGGKDPSWWHGVEDAFRSDVD